MYINKGQGLGRMVTFPFYRHQVFIVCIGVILGFCGKAVALDTWYPTPRVILGKEVSSFDVPFFCTLFVDFPSDAGTSLCGCVLIKPGVVLSAAHCFINLQSERFSSARIRLYGSMLESHPDVVTVRRDMVFVHPGYSVTNIANDVALFHAAEVTDAESIVLNDSPGEWNRLGAQDKLSVVGIGKTESRENTFEYDWELRRIVGIPHVSALSRRDCEDPGSGYGALQGYSVRVHQNDICAGPFFPCRDGLCADACGGDSGGPLYQTTADARAGNVTLFGIVSRGPKVCGEEYGRPGIYSPIHKHHAFITKYSADPIDRKVAASGATLNPIPVFTILASSCLLLYLQFDSF